MLAINEGAFAESEASEEGVSRLVERKKGIEIVLWLTMR